MVNMQRNEFAFIAPSPNLVTAQDFDSCIYWFESSRGCLLRDIPQQNALFIKALLITEPSGISRHLHNKKGELN